MADNFLQLAGIAFILGLSSGLSPGPLLTLVITQTVQYNRTEGIKVAVSPLITDFPIVLLALLAFKQIADFDIVLALISFLGGSFIAYLGIDALKTKKLETNVQNISSGSYKKGIIANFLNPHPYVFWITVNASLVYQAYEISLLAAALYLLIFYSMLIGSKILVASLVSHSKSFLNQLWYKRIMIILGIVLLFFSLIFFYDGIKYLLV